MRTGTSSKRGTAPYPLKMLGMLASVHEFDMLADGTSGWQWGTQGVRDKPRMWGEVVSPVTSKRLRAQLGQTYLGTEFTFKIRREHFCLLCVVVPWGIVAVGTELLPDELERSGLQVTM